MTKLKLPPGIHRQVRDSGRVRYYWHPGRGTASAGPRVRLPDNPHSPEFWAALAMARGEGMKPKAAHPTISEMVEAYFVSSDYQGLTEGTQKTYSRVLRQLCADLGTHDPREIKPGTVARIRDNLKDQPGRAHTIITVIGSLYRWGVELEWADINPATGVRKPELGEHAPWPQEALAAIPGLPPSVGWVCMVGLCTGQRISDIRKMKRTDLRPGGKIYVKQQKTKKELLIPIHRDIARMLTITSDYICERSPGEPWTAHGFDHAFGRAVEAVSFPSVVFHGLRKNATVRLLEAGCSPSEAASITGHSLKMVEHYAKTVHQSRLAETAMGKYELYPGTETSLKSLDKTGENSLG